MPKSNKWTREELILAINLYCKTPFGKIHQLNPYLIHLGRLIGRTPGAVALKLSNFASFDPSLQARGIKGLRNTSNLDKEIWDEFYNNWEQLAFESERLLAAREGIALEQLAEAEDLDPKLKGLERERVVRVRVNQHFFRRMVLSAYDDTCCITGLRQRELLVAGHIIPWGVDRNNRMNPRNGLAINALHDRAFEKGLIAITPDFRIQVANELLRSKDEVVNRNFGNYHGQEIKLPKRFRPDPVFLNEHYETRFRK